MKKRIVLAIMMILFVIGLAKIFTPPVQPQLTSQARVHHKLKHVKKKSIRPYQDPSDLRPLGTWRQKSEAKEYPKIKNNKNLVLRVSLEGNRVYVIKNNKVVYTMLSTAGKFKNGKSETPTGTFHIQHDRGEVFFNYALNEGAKNWTSWDKKNVFLFHSVPTKPDGTFNVKEAEKLGKTQGSHGCVRLSLPDSKWVMQHIPKGTKVIIKNH